MSKIKDYKFEIILLGISTIAYITFCNYLMTELPHMTWFDQIDIADKYFDGSLGLKDFLHTYGEHGLFGYYILFLINIIVFGMSTFFDVYLNDISVFIIGLISVITLKNLKSGEKDTVYILSVLAICMFSFSFYQMSSGAMESQVRLGLLFFVIFAVMADKVLRENVTKKYLITSIVFMFISVNIFGTLYSFAGAPVIFSIAFFYIIKTKKNIRKHAILIVSYLISMVVYFLEYNLIGKGNMSGGLIDSIFGLVLNPVGVMKGLVAYNGSSLLGFAVQADRFIPDSAYLTIGIVVTFLLAVAVFCFIKVRMYKKTMLPIMFIGYSFFVYILTLIGRYPETSEWNWFVNNWYTVHTKLQIVGMILIFYYNAKEGKKEIKIWFGIGIVLLSLGSVIGFAGELKRVPDEKAYYENKQPYLFAERIEELPVDENGNTPLLHTPEMTMYAINVMREHNLSVYRYYRAYNEMKSMSGRAIGSTFDTTQKIRGMYDDGWVEKEFEFMIQTGNNGKIVISGYYTGEITGNERISLTVDGVITEYAISNEIFNIELNAESNSIVDVLGKCNFSRELQSPDIRRLSFIISDINGK